MSEQSSSIPAFGAVDRDLLPERIANRLITLITQRRLRPGDKLPSERDLAAMMQVSRPSLREALRALAMMKIIEIRQGSGTYVTSLEPELLVEHLDFVFALDDSTFTELTEARAMLEPGIAAAAAQNATDAELADIRDCMERATATVHDPDLFLKADLELHQLIIAAAHNQIITRFMTSLNRLGLASRSRTVTLQGLREQSLKDHRAIVAALFHRNAKTAASVMQKHLEHIRDSLRDIAAYEDI